MKYLFGYIIFGAGFVGVVMAIQKDLSLWWTLLTFTPFIIGLVLIIDDRIETFFKNKEREQESERGESLL